ncbi:MAG: carboxypeptidase regulatory-like domain-containing protein [Candidatus Hydrogenedentes bacterium]|nr:carboxypeptidase regulatory-like domain-containing protein [Candidatus Hydrogenedentota bacterium]
MAQPRHGDLVLARFNAYLNADTPAAFAPAQQPETLYNSYATLTAALQELASAYPTLCELRSIGQSRQGRELWVMRITDNPGMEEAEPEFKYISTMHGDEPVGTELTLYLIQRLLEHYDDDARMAYLVDNTDISILPLMNPDGRENGTRENANGRDLNRVFPVYPRDFTQTIFEAPLNTSGRQPEVRHVMEWSAANSFVLSANLHTGALLVNYPYDEDGRPSGANAPSPDDALFRVISLQYAQENPPMFASSLFPNGISNGSDWFAIDGGMQDWNYRFLTCAEVTIELSNTKRPNATTLPQFWEDNEESLVRYMEAVHEYGVRGIITDRSTDEPVWARVTVTGNTQPVLSDPGIGDYYRLLLPGAYTLRFESPGYILFTAANIDVASGTPTVVDVSLSTGDLNGDTRVNAVDVQSIVAALLRGDTAQGSPYDVDGRGVTSTDLQRIVNIALGRGGDL